MVAGTVASTIDIASDGFCVDQLTRTGYGWGNSAGRRQLSGNDVRRRGVPDAVGGIRLACRHADDGGADYGAVTPAVAHYGADANSDYPACSGVRLCAKEEAGAPGLLLVLMLNSGMRFVLPLLAPLLLDHGLSMSALGALFSGGNIAAGIAGTLAGGLLMKYTSPGRALLTAYGVQGSRCWRW